MKNNKKFLFGLLLIIVLIIVAVVFRLNDKNVLTIMQKESNDHVLKIHSPLNERIIIPIIKEFQETTGIKVEYLSAGTMDLLKSLDTKDDNYLMDVMWGGSKEYLSIYKDLFEPYVSVNNNEIDQSNNDADNYFLGYNLLPIVLIYNTKLVSPEEVPKTWMDILDDQWMGEIAFVDPSMSGSAFLALSFMLDIDQDDGNYNWANAEALVDNINGKILAKSSEVYEGVAKGDFAIGISMEEAAIDYIHEGQDIGIVYLEEGTPVITDSIALMKDAENREEAMLFIDFVLSKQVQTYMVDYFYLRSIRDDVHAPKALLPMEELNVFDTEQLDTYEKKTYILETWNQIIDHKKKDVTN